MLFSVFDTETTGFTSKDRLLEIGIVQINESGEIVREFETLINPERDIANSHIHGISPSMIYGAPKFENIAAHIVEFLEQSALVLAFNLPFDWRMLGYEFKRLGYEAPSNVPKACLMSFIRKRLPEAPRKLGDLCRHLKIDLTQAHSALGDARATAELFKLFLKDFNGPSSRVTWSRESLLPPSGPLRRADLDDATKTEVPVLDRLIRALGATSQVEDFGPYFELLDQVFADSILEENEVDELLALAVDLGMTADDARVAHQTYIDGIYQIALKDGFLSEMESRHLGAISIALDVIPNVDPTKTAELELYPRDLSGKVVCFTGAPEGMLEGEVLDRNQMSEIAKNAGVVVKSGVSKKLDFLVAGDPYSMSGKAQKAREYGVPVVSEQVFWNWLGVQVCSENEGSVPTQEDSAECLTEAEATSDRLQALAEPTSFAEPSASSLNLELVYNLHINYAAFQNSVPVVNLLALENRGEESYKDLVLQISLEPEIATTPWVQRLSKLGPGQRFEPALVDLPLSADRLVKFDERERGYLHARVSNKSGELLRESYPLEVLAYNEWGGGEVAPQLLAAFSQPNHPRIGEVFKLASSYLENWTGNSAFDGYQSKSKKRAREMAASFYFAFQGLGLQYINPPASFEKTGQKIRTVDQILDQSRGTCLDLTMLFCACLESAGLHPLVVMIEGHAFPGVWLEEASFDHTVTDEPLALLKRVEIGQICLFDSSSATQVEVKFEWAESRAKEYVENSFLYVLDVKQAREEKILPLSSRHSVAGVGFTPVPVRKGPNDEKPLELKNLDILEQVDVQTPATLDSAELRINKWKEKLLDLSLRNRLLNFKAQKKTLTLQHQNLPEFEDLLAAEKTFRVLPKLEISKDRDQSLHQGRTGEDILKEKLESELKSGRLHVSHTTEELEKRLVAISREAKTIQEETGSNTLFLALGFLEWYESESSEEPRRSPILLVPVNVERKGVGKPFELKTADEDTQINITLLEKLRREFGIEMPGLDILPEDESGLHVARIFLYFKRSILEIPRWRVVEESCLGFFSFTKFLMWQDLQNGVAELEENPVVARLLGKASLDDSSTQHFLPVEDLDTRRPPHSCLCPLDADSSQLSAVYAAEEGQSFVLQGPPGTGKSQTITNLISQSLASGKRVLFVAEKRAALEVVFKRLAAVGLGAFCLELHSKKARKRDILDQLKASLELGREQGPEGWLELSQELQASRARLNQYAQELHKPTSLGFSFFEALSQLAGLADAPRFSFAIDGSETLNRERFLKLNEIAGRIESACQETSQPNRDHPLFGIGVDDYSPKQAEKLSLLLEKVEDRVKKTKSALEEAAMRLGFEAGYWSRESLARLAHICDTLWQSPELPPLLVEAPGWSAQKEQVEEWLSKVSQTRRLRETLEADWKPGCAVSLDLEALISKYETHENSNALLAFFSLWGARKALKPALKRKLSKDVNVLESLRTALQLRSTQQELDRVKEEAKSVLGPAWQSEDTDIETVEGLLRWAEDFRKHLFWLEEQTSQSNLRSHVAKLLGTVRERWDKPFLLVSAHEEMTESYEALLRAAQPTKVLLDELEESKDFLESLRARANNWRSSLGSLREWSVYVRARNEAVQNGLGGLIEKVEDGELPFSASLLACRYTLLDSWVREVFEENETLRHFRGESHSRLIEKFRKDDAKSLQLAQQVIRAKIAARIPVMGDSTSPNSELGILKREIKKQRAHLSCRRLFEKLPNLLPVLKPCVLMSPLSVSQYLGRDTDKFDLVVFDEASQITVWDSIGSLLRAKQAVVVGDSKQLPPTSFFNIQESEDAANPEGTVEDLESILDECQASGMPEHLLRWHYRSRHEDLITFSNRRYYDSKLLTFPSALTEHPRLGLKFRRVEGTYDRGGSRTNRAEAEAIVNTIIERLHDPERRVQSIGVVTFNTQQQVLIEDLLDQARLKLPSIDPYFTSAVEEPVFVKNLENVQGDERDVILFSITFGPDQAGNITMNFGPINKSGGERRLNVAVTRARERLEVYSSLRPTDIDLNRTNQLGSRHLRAFLSYAERGMMALMNTAESDWQANYDSPFEEEVGKALEAKGWVLHRQVGCLGYRLDLGVVHPEIPGVYLAGVECDGATYHSSKCARDRDRIRQAVLESLGWNIHRVWSSDWWHDSKREIEKLDRALRRTLQTFTSSEAIPFSVTNEPNTRESTQIFESSELDALYTQPETSGEGLPSWEGQALPGTKSYETADLTAFQGSSDDYYDKLKTGNLRTVVEKCLEVEAPISLTEATRRVGERFDVKRVTKRARKRLSEVVNLIPEGKLREDIIWFREQDPTTYDDVRLPTDEYRRDAEDICDEEIANGVALVLKQNIALPSEDLVRETARLFGFKQLGSKVKARMEAGLELLLVSGRCSEVDGQISCGATVR